MKLVAILASALAVTGVCGPASPVTAAELTLLASNAINVILDEVIPQFERESGHKVTMRLGVASALRREIEDGAKFDVAILVGNVDGLVKQGRIAADTPAGELFSVQPRKAVSSA